MRRTVVNKSYAIKAVVILFAVIFALSIYPVRFWQRIITEHGDAELVGTSERINDYRDVVQKFTAQYDRIESIDVYVENLEKGQYLTLLFYNPDMTVLYRKFYHIENEGLPGYVKLPLKLDVEVGQVYTARICGCFSTFYLGYVRENYAQYPYLQRATYFGKELVLQNLAMRINYQQPWSKTTSIIIILADLLAAALICFGVNLYYNNREDKLITVHRVVKFVGNPIAAAIVATLMIMIFPMKTFDDRVIDIVFYEAGIAIAGFFLFYAINHENDATLDTKMWHNVLNVMKMSTIAAALWFCCEYMNAFYTIYQTIAERKEMICLLLLLILMIPRDKILRGINLVYLVVASIIGMVYRHGHLMAETENEYDLNNAALTYGVIVVILAGFVVMHILIEAYNLIKEKKFGARLTFTGILFLVLSVVLIVFRNTRWWGVVLVAFTIALIFCYAQFETSIAKNKKGYMEIVIGGILLNFVVSMIYCWLYRAFAAFNTGRFPFVFHTVTVTAEYMTVMVAASMTLLLYKIYETRDKKGIREKFRYMWKEFILFGFVTAYMIFTMSRTAYLSCVVMFFFISIITITDCETKRIRYWLSQVFILFFSIVICFVPAFTLQRILPAIYGHPKYFSFESVNLALNGGGDPASTLYMSVERFVDLFSEKVLGKDLIDYNEPEDKLNYDDEGYPLYGDNGVTLTERQSKEKLTGLRDIVFAEDTDDETKIYLMESAGLDLNIDYKEIKFGKRILRWKKKKIEEKEEEETDLFSEEGIETVSNGRLSIFKAYLREMNLFGHEEMGAVLDSGEVAIHAHNTYLQVMYDNGIIAGIVFGIFVFVSAVSAGIYYRKNREKVPGALLAYAMVLCFAVAAVTEWVFQFSNPMTIALLLAVIPVAVNKQEL